jgi:TolB protein
VNRHADRFHHPRALVLSLATLFLFALGCGSSTPAAEPTPTVDNSTMSRIAFVSKRDGNWEIYVMNADGSDQRNITNNPGLDSYPSWSGDGSRIVFASDRDGNRNIYAMDPDGSNVVRLTDSPGVDDMPALSPDGKLIAFVSDRDDRPNLWVMNADGSEPRNLTPKQVNTRWPSWSPDGLLIAYEHSSAIFTAAAADGAQDRLVRNRTDIDGHFVGWPSWAPDGHSMALTIRYGLKGSPPSIYTMASDGEDIEPIQRKPGDDTEERPTYSPDGRYLVFSAYGGGAEPDVYVVEIETNQRTRLTGDPALDAFPAWEPRGFVPDYPKQPGE